jgi:hypothetical protein
MHEWRHPNDSTQFNIQIAFIFVNAIAVKKLETKIRDFPPWTFRSMINLQYNDLIERSEQVEAPFLLNRDERSVRKVLSIREKK